MPRAEGEIQVLHKKQNVRGELDSFAETNSGSIFPGDRDQEGRNLSPVGIPKKKGKKERLIRARHTEVHQNIDNAK